MRFKITKRTVSFKMNIIITTIAFLCALLIGAVLLAIAGINPLQAYMSMLEESLGSKYGVTETLVQAIPLLITGLGLSIAFRMKLWNIGAEGQICMGAFGATFMALFSGIENHAVMLTAMFASAAVAGGLWSAAAGYLKSKLDVNEVVTTLLMNYIAISFINYFVFGPWKDPAGNNFPNTAFFADTARLSSIADSRLHTGLFMGIILAVIIYIYLDKTVWGYELKVIGDNPKAAGYAGMNSSRQIIIVMFLSGALAGIAGFAETAGLQHRLQSGISAGYGYTAIIVAWLGKCHPAGVVFVSLIMGILLVGGDGLKTYYSLSGNLINAYLGLILFSLVIGDFFTTHKIQLKRKQEEPV